MWDQVEFCVSPSFPYIVSMQMFPPEEGKPLLKKNLSYIFMYNAQKQS